MKRKARKTQQQNSIVLWCLSAAFFCGILAAGYFLMRTEKTITAKVLILGDSIYGEDRGTDGIEQALWERLGYDTYNGAIGGTRLARLNSDRQMEGGAAGLTLAALSKSLISGDFGVQQRIHAREESLVYLDRVIDELEQLDMDRVETLLLGYGMNDYQTGVPLDNAENPMDEYCFSGALRKTLSLLRRRYPGLRIILLTPTYSWYPDQQMSCEEKDWGGGTLNAYVEAVLEVAGACQVEVVDLYHDLYSKEEFEDWRIYTRDGVHPTELGRQLIGNRIVEYLEENP